MQYRNVQSSNIKAIGYDDSTSTLGVQFLDGSTYHYFNVPKNLYNGLMSADSHGKFLNSEIKTKGYRYEKQ